MADAQSNSGESEDATKKGIEVRRPAKENIRDAMELEDIFAADLYAPTHFPLGRRFMEKIKYAPWIGPIKVLMKQTGSCGSATYEPYLLPPP